MTREEAAIIIKECKDKGFKHTFYTLNEYHTALDIAIKALEQEPRKMVGSWIKSRDSYGNNHFTCPFCGHDIATKADTLGDNYCSNCGAKLQESEPRESEE